MVKKTAVVTGATGCLGHAIVKALVGDSRADWTVHVITRESSDLTRLHDIHGDIRLGWPFGTIDAVFHCAGNTSFRAKDQHQLFADNVLFTRKVVGVARARGVGRFIHTSTGAVHSATPLASNNETVKNWYPHTKALAEEHVKDHPDHVILQPCVILGEGDRKNYVNLFKLAKHGKLRFCMKGGIEVGYVHDIAKAHVEAFWKGKKNNTYMLGGEYVTWKALFQDVVWAVNKPVGIWTLPTWMLKMMMWAGGESSPLTPSMIDLLAREGRVPNAHRLKSRKDLGYFPTMSVGDMVKATYRWTASNGLLE